MVLQALTAPSQQRSSSVAKPAVLLLSVALQAVLGGAARISDTARVKTANSPEEALAGQATQNSSGPRNWVNGMAPIWQSAGAKNGDIEYGYCPDGVNANLIKLPHVSKNLLNWNNWHPGSKTFVLPCECQTEDVVKDWIDALFPRSWKQLSETTFWKLPPEEERTEEHFRKSWKNIFSKARMGSKAWHAFEEEQMHSEWVRWLDGKREWPGVRHPWERFFHQAMFPRLASRRRVLHENGCEVCQFTTSRGDVLPGTMAEKSNWNDVEVTCYAGRDEASSPCRGRTFLVTTKEQQCHPCPPECKSCTQSSSWKNEFACERRTEGVSPDWECRDSKSNVSIAKCKIHSQIINRWLSVADATGGGCSQLEEFHNSGVYWAKEIITTLVKLAGDVYNGTLNGLKDHPAGISPFFEVRVVLWDMLGAFRVLACRKRAAPGWPRFMYLKEDRATCLATCETATLSEKEVEICPVSGLNLGARRLHEFLSAPGSVDWAQLEAMLSQYERYLWKYLPNIKEKDRPLGRLSGSCGTPGVMQTALETRLMSAVEQEWKAATTRFGDTGTAAAISPLYVFEESLQGIRRKSHKNIYWNGLL